jgi:hypothetical protein
MIIKDREITQRERDLIADVAEMQARIDQLVAERDQLEEKLTNERFKDCRQLPVGTMVLFPRLVFGEHRDWPGVVTNMRHDYSSGTFNNGEPWENLLVAYGVDYEQANGEIRHDGFYDKQVVPAPHLEGTELAARLRKQS